MSQESLELLLVEDDPGQARLAERVLGRAGYTLAWVASAAACLDRVRAARPLMVLLDRNLPDGDGLELLGSIRAEAPDTCVIMLTGADDVNIAVRAMRAGAWDYVLKRPDLSHLDDLPLVIERNRERMSLRQERERLDAAVRLSEERYRELFDNASDLIVVCDAEGVIQETNRAFEALTGVSPEAAAGRPLSEFIGPTSPTSAADLRESAAGGSEAALASEVQLVDRDRQPVVVEFRTRPLRLGGIWRGFQSIGRDVTEKRRMDEVKADFLAMVTHDMKNPVSIIAGYTEMLLNESPHDSEHREMLAAIDLSARGLLHLIANFLDLSRVEAGGIQLNRSPVSLSGLLSRVIDQQRPLARAKGVSIERRWGEVPMLNADRLQLERVFANLVGNAVKFTPSGGQVAVETRFEDGWVVAVVADTGPGIPAGEIPSLFAKYRRLVQATDTPGTGLGLFIAKSVVEAHGGSVRVESAPGAGATFIVSLPAASGLGSDAEAGIETAAPKLCSGATASVTVAEGRLF